MKILKIITLVVIVLVMSVLFFVLINSRDLPAVNDANLLLAPVPILAKSDNAYYNLENLSKIELKDKWVVTDTFIAASKKPGYQCPTSVNDYSFDVELCSLNDLRDMADLTAQRATVALESGATDDAVESAVAVVQMARLLSESQGPLIEQLVAIAMYDIGIDVLTVVVESGDLSNEQEQVIAELIITKKPVIDHLHNALRAEYMQHKDVIARIDTGEFSNADQFGASSDMSAYAWQPNRTTNHLADVYRLMIDGDPNNEGDALVAELTEFSPMMFVMPNRVGNIYLSVIVGSLSGVYARFREVEAKYDLLFQRL